jgi:hypothetical protein
MFLTLLAVAVTLAVGGAGAPTGSAAVTSAELSLDEVRRLPPIYAAVYHHPDAVRAYQKAERRLVTDCMARAGLAYDDGARQAGPERDQLPEPFGLESVPQDAAGGGGVSEAPRPDGERYGRALYGDPTKRIVARGAQLTIGIPGSGCLADAERRLQGQHRVRLLELRIQLFEAEREAVQRADGDAELGRLRAEWRDCMRAAGAPADDPATLRGRLPAGAALAANPLARADLACKDETDFLRRGYRRLAALQDEALARRPGTLAEWNELGRWQDAQVRAVLAG